MLEGHYPVRVTVVLVDGWAPVGLIWLIFFLSMLWTALFTQSAAGSAQILNPRLVMNLQYKEKIAKLVTSSKPWGQKLRSDHIKELLCRYDWINQSFRFTRS